MASSADDVHGLWQQQPAEPTRVEVEVVRRQAREFESRTRRWRMVGAAVVLVLVAVEGVQVFWPGGDLLERSGDLLTIAAFAYIAYEYRKYTRLRPERLGQTSCLDFYRAMLVYESNLARQSARFLLPFVPGVSLSLLGGVVGEGIPVVQRVGVVLSGVALFLGVAWWNARTARKLRDEITALEGLQ